MNKQTIKIRNRTWPILDALDHFGGAILDQNSNLHAAVPETYSAPFDIHLEVATRCNFSCIHCYNRSGPQGQALDENTLNRVVEQIIDQRPFRCFITGGEPTLYLAQVLPIAEKMRRSGIQTTLVTNGAFDAAKWADRLTACFHGVHLSLDGAVPETHDRIRNQPGSYQQVLAALAGLAGKVKHLQVNFTALSVNCQEIPALVDRLVDRGVKALQIQPIFLYGRAVDHPDLAVTDACFHRLVELVSEARSRAGRKLRLRIADSAHTLGRHFFPDAAPNQTMYICANGDVFYSPYVPIKAGNGLETPLSLIWKDNLAGFYSRSDVRDDFAAL